MGMDKKNPRGVTASGAAALYNAQLSDTVTFDR